MKRKIKKMYYKDCTAMLISMLTFWMILIYTLTKISAISPNSTIRMVIITVGIMVGAFGTVSSIAVVNFLKKNQIKLYTEELLYYECNSEIFLRNCDEGKGSNAT